MLKWIEALHSIYLIPCIHNLWKLFVSIVSKLLKKAIKALFVLKEIEIVKIHDLGMLIKMIQTEIVFPDTITISAIRLTKYAATFRYPQSPDIDEALTRKALTDMETVITWCKEQIVLAGYEIE